jgi:hypothetical protein
MLIIIVVLAVILSLISLAGGIFCIVRYAKTRKIAFLIIGLILTFIIPGLCLFATLVVYIPSATVVYGPPPTMIVYGPPPTMMP